MHASAALRRFILTELSFNHHLNAISTLLIQPLKRNISVSKKLHPRSTLAGLLQIASCRSPLHSSFRRILDHVQPETFDIDADVCIGQCAEYLDVFIESVKCWSSSGLPDFFAIWNRQRRDSIVRQALIDIGDADASWNRILQPEINWKNKSVRLDVFTTCLLPFYVVRDMISAIEQIQSHLHFHKAAQLALIAQHKLEALDAYLYRRSDTMRYIRQIRILAVEYLIDGFPMILADRFRNFEKAALFQLTIDAEMTQAEKVVLLSFGDILIWADFESKSFLGSVYRSNCRAADDPKHQRTIRVFIDDAKHSEMMLQSSERQQHEEWIRFLNPVVDVSGPVQQERRHSLLNKYPAQTLSVEIRFQKHNDDNAADTDEILVRHGDRPSKLAYLFSSRHRLKRTMTAELCHRLHAVALSRCQDVQLRRQLYLGRPHPGQL